MSRLIDADAFKAEMAKKYGAYARQPQVDIDAQPTVDAVPVVRCGECKYIERCGVLDTFFCADGKRREDD